MNTLRPWTLKQLMVVLCAVILTWSTTSSAYIRDEDRVIPKPLMNSIIYGVGAGALVGFVAIGGFHRNFRAHIEPQSVYRGMSWGLYGGIILGLYITYLSEPDRTQDELDNNEQEIDTDFEYNPGFQSNYEVNKSQFSLASEKDAFIIQFPVIRF
jgi:hypothetical protein